MKMKYLQCPRYEVILYSHEKNVLTNKCLDIDLFCQMITSYHVNNLIMVFITYVLTVFQFSCSYFIARMSGWFL